MMLRLEKLGGARLLLVRHGETAWNREAVLQGQEDVGLSPSGRLQASALAPIVARFAPATAVSSDLSRARETAALLGFEDARASAVWREADLGAWTGRAKADLQREDAVSYQEWRDGRLDPPGGEGWAALRERIGEALPALADEANYGGAQLVVTHGGVIRAACSLLVGLEPNCLVAVDPGSLTVFDFDVNGAARLKAFNVGGKLFSTEDPSE